LVSSTAKWFTPMAVSNHFILYGIELVCKLESLIPPLALHHLLLPFARQLLTRISCMHSCPLAVLHSTLREKSSSSFTKYAEYLCDGFVGDVGVGRERGRVEWVLEFGVGRNELGAQAYIYRVGKVEGWACA